MQKRTLKVALLAVLAIALVFGMSTMASAATWSDLPDSVTAKYGITDNQVAAISDGFPGGVWKPFQAVTRAQFTKMAVAAFNIPLATPATASFTDVAVGSAFFPHIEAAKAAGIINGTSATTFSPNANITRQQAIAIVSRYVAAAAGYNLATMYTADELAALLAHFGDAASISADLKKEVAFAFDMGLTKGNDFGNVAPLANMTRIQGAAFLIRAQALVPPNLWTPAKIELVSADKTEGLIGQAYTVTFAVTDPAGHPAKGILVDFDSLGGAEFYVGNITQQALLTNSAGQATVQLISLEPGTQRVSASVAGVGTVYTTRYWVAIDEVYNLKGKTAQNNAGTEHEWAVRVLVFGPGPRSTSQNDWYNFIDASFDPTNINVLDGVDAHCDRDYSGYKNDKLVIDRAGDLAGEKYMAAKGFTPRTLAGINVKWSIYNVLDDPKTFANEAYTSVGNIIAVDGVAVTPAKTAVGKTDAAGYSSMKVYSTVTGKTYTEAIADYAGNPYPQQMFTHRTFQDNQRHYTDWEDQPKDATQVKTWISHTIGTPAGPISPAYTAANIGEEPILTITLVDTYGNPVAGKYVEWTMQGVGFFQTDDAGDKSDPYKAANNVDFDVTNAQGKATLFVKSYWAGEQIIHAKVRDKGTGGAEGTFVMYSAEVQWFDVNIATFDNITTIGKDVPESTGVKAYYDPENEACATNAVNTSHQFCLYVYGLKLEYYPTLDYPDGQTPIIDTDAAGSAYDGIFDAKDAAYLGGILMMPQINRKEYDDVVDNWLFGKLIEPWGYEVRVQNKDGSWNYDPNQCKLMRALPYDKNDNGIIDPNEAGKLQVKIAGKWITLSFAGAYTRYDWNSDCEKEPFTGVPGIYLPLAGKTATFANTTGSVGKVEPLTATTDAAGKACTTVSSTVKGLQTVKATVDWPGNPHNGPQLVSAFAKKSWQAGTVGPATDVTIEVWIDGIKAATNKAGKLADVKNPAWTIVPGEGQTAPEGYVYKLNSAHVEVHVLDAFGNDLADYEVVYLLESIDSWLGGSQGAAHTYIPWAYLTDIDTTNTIGGEVYDLNGPRPDADEPTPASDPFAYIVGKGGTQAFYFNQWLGSERPVYEGQPGLASWWTRIAGMPFLGYYADKLAAEYFYTWPGKWNADALFDGFDGYIDGYYDGDVGLATDGAKAWTLDGYIKKDAGVVKNLQTGSHIDIQLADAYVAAFAEDSEYWEAGRHLKSILRVMVYAPADGLVREGAYIWSTQVHKVWEIPTPTTIKLSPATDWTVASYDYGFQSVVATVYDQFGRPMPDVDLTLLSSIKEGDVDQFGPTYTSPVYLTTDINGNVTLEWWQMAGTWGVEEVVAFVDKDNDDVIDTNEVKSNTATIQWVYLDGMGTPGELVEGLLLGTKVMVWAGYTPWDNKTLEVYLNPQASVFGRGLVSGRTWLRALSTSPPTCTRGSCSTGSMSSARTARTPTTYPTGSTT